MDRFNRLPVACLFVMVLFVQVLHAQDQSNPIDGFRIGADLSMAKAIIDKGGIYYIGTKPVDLLPALTDRKFSYARLRLFHTPDGRSANGTVNSLAYTIALAKLIRESGMKILLDFHYSDTWADPSRQTKPAVWSSLNFNALNDSILNYTKNTLNQFAANGVYPDMVQTGNEINHGMLWPDGSSWNGNKPNYANLATLIRSAIRGVRESTGGATIPVMLHSATGGSIADTRIFLDSLAKYDVRFDVIGLSYYITWHGPMPQLEANLNWLNSNYPQSIFIAETSYQADGTLPAGSVVSQSQLPFPFTPQGQYDYLQALYAMAIKYPKVKGLCYWGGELIWVGDIGGSWAALFNWDGKARKGLDAFRDLLSGTGEAVLPDQEFAVYTDAGNRLVVRTNRCQPGCPELSIYDAAGKKLYSTILVAGDNRLGFNPPETGIYVVGITADQEILYRKKILLTRY